MGMPRKLKHFNVYNDAESCLGEVLEITLPTLSRSMEDYRGGGMSGPVKIDNGMEALEVETKYGGVMRSVLRQFGIATHDGVQLRFAGSYQREDSGAVDAVEIIVRGRHQEIGRGNAKEGEDTEFSAKTACSYYKEVWNGQVVAEIDFVNMIEIIDGVDRLAEHRRAIGIS